MSDSTIDTPDAETAPDDRGADRLAEEWGHSTMPPQSQSSSASSAGNGSGGGRLHIRAIREMPAGHDEELAKIFREMRRAADATREQIAGRLSTDVRTIEAFESGAILGLPPWEETSRIVTAYAAHLGLDSRPILRRLQAQIGAQPEARQQTDGESGTPRPQDAAQDAGGSEAPQPQGAAQGAGAAGPPMPPGAGSAAGPAPSASPDGKGETAAQPPPGQAAAPGEASPPPETGASAEAAPAAPPEQQAAADASASPGRAEAAPAAASQAGERETSGWRDRMGPIAGWLVLLVFVAGLGYGIWSAVQRPQTVWTAVDSLPDPVPTLMRAAWELVRPLDVNGAETGQPAPDPDTRKGDKLP